MSELLEIIISAVDQASDVLDSITGSANDMGDEITGSLEQTQAAFDNANAEVERLTEELAAIYMGDVEGDAEAVEAALAAAQDEAQRLAQAIDDVEKESDESKDALDSMADLASFQQIGEWVTQLADAMWQVADKAGTVQDSWTRLGLAAEGANIPVDQMKNSVSALSSETGRAGGSIRESFIAMSSAGVTELSAMESAFKGASAQSFILGTDVDNLVNKFSGMAMKSSIAERTLKGTGITVDELGSVLGIQGATIDDVNAKWETMDTNARMAALGQASAMNEGKDANDAYKNSWEGLQAQIDIAKGKLEVLAGKVFLPVLIPVMETAARVMDWLGTTIGAVMDGPLGGFISILGSLGGGLVLLLGAITAITAGMGFFSASLMPAIAASWALLAPWLPWIALGAAIVAVIYEIGVAFGWWSDASSMVDALWAGIQRLWSAFINHPAVQAAIEAISNAISTLWTWIQQAGQAVLEFFGVTTGGDFDIVRAIIDGVGAAFNGLYSAIMTVVGAATAVWNTINWVAGQIWAVIGPFVMQIISFIQNIINTINAFKAGQMSLPQFIWTILTLIVTHVQTMVSMVISRIVSFGSRMVSQGISAATRFVNGIVNWLRQLPGRVYSALIGVVGRISSAISHWASTASSHVQTVISNITSPFSGVVSAISGALSGVANAITKPFQDAWNMVSPWVDKIKGGIDMIANALPSFGGEPAYGGETLADVNSSVSSSQYIVEADNSPIEINDNINLSLDLRNVPSHINTGDLIEALSDKNVLSAIANNRDFQDIDAKVKQRISLKTGRARGR